MLSRIPRSLGQKGQRLFARPLSTSVPRLSSWSPSPAPPRLPREEQELFEKLQQQSTGAFSSPREDVATVKVNQSPDSVASATPAKDTLTATVKADGKGEELHPNIRRGAPPEFEGEINPKTGEVGGPKNEPLRWGHGGDWSYNGRVTDF